MKWLDKLERKFGKYYISNLMMKIIILSAVVYFITFYILQDYNYINGLTFDINRILKGEVWRIFTFVFIPPLSGSLFMVLISLYFDYLAGVNLEHEWGEFRFNVYFLFGMIGTMILSSITGAPATGSYVTTSIFLAFAKLFPDFTVLLFFIIPIKMKWMGYLTWAGIIFNIVIALAGGSVKSALLYLVPLINYFLFFGVGNYKNAKLRTGSKIRKMEYNKAFKAEEKPYRHKCTVCGITDADDKNMLFRYCSKCNGDYAYCEKHIKNHEHIK
ncbi:MAG: hypothetical protein Q4F66_05855 [Clostridium sp.]|nr:hypothetical protein [Clostridium sp.]